MAAITKKRKDDLLLICKYMGVENVFPYFWKKEEAGLYIADDADGDFDIEEMRIVNYDCGLNQIAPVAQKVINKLQGIVTINFVSVAADNCLNEINKAAMTFDIAIIFPTIIKGIEIINGFEMKSAEDLKRN